MPENLTLLQRTVAALEKNVGTVESTEHGVAVKGRIAASATAGVVTAGVGAVALSLMGIPGNRVLKTAVFAGTLIAAAAYINKIEAVTFEYKSGQTN